MFIKIGETILNTSHIIAIDLDSQKKDRFGTYYKYLENETCVRITTSQYSEGFGYADANCGEGSNIEYFFYGETAETIRKHTSEILSVSNNTGYFILCEETYQPECFQPPVNEPPVDNSEPTVTEDDIPF